jgi:serine/threonine protein kinase/sugar lactone lactonase YvrE
MYIADYNNDVIRLVNDSSGEITTFGGTHGDYIPASGDGGPATAAAFDPIAVAVDSGGNVYISDHDNQRIRKIAISTGIISTYAGNGGTSFVDNAAATLCSLNNPTDIAFDAYDNLFIADENSNRIRKVIAQTMYMTTVAGSASTMTYFGDGGQATSAALYQPMGVTVGPSSNLYIADTSNQVVRKVTYGIITTIAGTGQTASGVLHDGSKSTLGEYNGDNIPATSASLNRPFSTYLDNSVLYIADSYNNRIRMVDLTTGLISTVAGTGATSYNGDSIAATSANLNTPSLVALDNNGHMIIADSFNNRIRKLTPMPTAPTVCPKGSFNNTETRTCESCPRNYYSDNVGSITCKSCPAYYLTPSVGATSADDCFDPYINFVLGFFAFLFVMGMIGIYMPTSRFLLLGLSQFYKYTDGKLVVCKNKINKRLDRDISELSDQYFEVSENNARTGIYIFELGNKFVFVLKSVVAVTFLTIINCIGALIIVLFGSMIIWRDYGGEIGLLYGDIMLHQVRKLDYLVEQISTPFVHFFSHLSSLSVDLDPINVHCEGPKSIILFAIYLFIVGTIVMVIVSDLNVVFNCIYLVLHEKRLRCFNFKVLKIFKLFPSWLCLTVMNLFLASRPIIWLSLAFVGCIRYYKLINFYPFYSDFDKICSDVHGGTLFDSGLAALCTILVFILIIPGIYCLADVFVPFYHEELVKPPNKDAASTSSDIPNVDIEDPSNPCVVRFCWPLRDTLSLIEMPEFKDYKYYANGLVPHWDSQAKWQYIMGRLAIDKNILRALHWYVKFIQSSSMNLDVFRRLKVLCGLPLHHGSNDNKSSSRSQSENHFKGYYEAFYTYKLPHFFALSSAVCKELGATTNPYTLYYYMWVFLAYSGLGHLLTRTGRYYWSRVADKYWIFLRVCLGIWSSREYKCYNILGDKYANELNLKSETMGFSKDVSFDPNSLMWSLISIRIVLLLLLPKFSVFCIFVINTAHVPLFTTEEGDYNIFINSPLGNKDSQDTAIDSTTCGDTRINNFSLKFNPLHPFKVEKVKEKKISSYLVDYYQDYKYPPYFKYIIFAYELVTKCRLVNWLYGCVLTTLSIGLLFNTKTPVWAYSGWVIIFPICFMRSLWVVTHFAIRHNFIQQSNGAKQLFGENNGDDTINPIGVYMTDTAGGNSSHNSTYNCSDSSSYHRVPLDQFHAPGILEDGDGSSSRVISAKLPKGKYYAIKLYKIKDEGQYKHLLDTMSRNIEFIKEIREKIKEEAKAFVNRPHALCEGREDFQKRMFGDNRSYPISLGLVMDFEEGGSLAYNLAEGNLENDKPGKNTTYKLGFLADIAKGLRDLHDIDYAHGDIKPANIILHLKRTPSITFIDFDHSVCIKKKEKKEAVVMPPSSVLKGTLRYTAPELVDETIAYDDSRSLNDITLSLRNATKEADMYAFGMLCWEVLMLKDEALTWKSFLQHKPYSNRPFNEFELLGMYKQLVIDKDEPPRPDPTKPPLSELPNIKRMITKCWQLNPNDRLDAEDCFTILHREYEIRRKKKYDIFLSHPWVDKKVVRHIKEFICKLGYSVWYDENDMDGYLEATMKEGIANSKVVVACINQKFQERKNCMFELGYASGIKKPIVAIFMEEEPFKWANKEVKDCCKMVGKVFLDIGDVCSKDWPAYDPKKSSEYVADEGLEKELARALKREGLKTELEKHIIVEQLNSLGLGFSGGSRGNDNKNKK